MNKMWPFKKKIYAERINNDFYTTTNAKLICEWVSDYRGHKLYKSELGNWFLVKTYNFNNDYGISPIDRYQVMDILIQRKPGITPAHIEVLLGIELRLM